MLKRKKETGLKYVMVTGTNTRGECFFEQIPVPKGGRFEYEYAGHPTVYDKEGQIVRIYD